MPNRRHFIKTAAILTGGLALSRVSRASQFFYKPSGFVSKRPMPGDRKFVSAVVDREIARIKEGIVDEELAWMFENCFPNTLDTTIRNFGKLNGKQDTFVITGDIPAMWLRDSSAQVMPYLPYILEDAQLKLLIQGVINRQVKCVLIDPYANAFNYDASVKSEWFTDETDMKMELHERKWEIDSLCYVIRLSYHFWKETGDLSVFDADWEKAMRCIITTFKEQQRKQNRGPYHFQRLTTVPTDTLTGGGYGAPARPNGLICSMFRPSDDATTFPYLIPSNLFAVVSLHQLSEIFAIKGNTAMAIDCENLANEVAAAVKAEAIVDHPTFGKVFAYEVDGFGNHYLMDDANMPNLLTLPYFGAVDRNDPIYMNTRRMILSNQNPFFFKGSAGEGVGSPHTKYGNIWPLSLIARALTSNDDDEISQCLDTLRNTHGNTGFMHESFNCKDPKDYSRSWFAWANTLFGEMVVKVERQKAKGKRQK